MTIFWIVVSCLATSALIDIACQLKWMREDLQKQLHIPDNRIILDGEPWKKEQKR